MAIQNYIIPIAVVALLIAFYFVVNVGADVLTTDSTLMSKTKLTGKNYYDERRAANYDECRRRCLMDPKCRAWMFASPTANNYDQRNMCSLTDEKPGTMLDRQYMSGITDRNEKP